MADKHRVYVSKEHALQTYLDMGYVHAEGDPEQDAKMEEMGCVLVEGDAVVHAVRNTPPWRFHFRHTYLSRADVRRVEVLEFEDEDGDAYITTRGRGGDYPEQPYKERLFESIPHLLAKHREDIIVSINELRAEALKLERLLDEGD